MSPLSKLPRVSCLCVIAVTGFAWIQSAQISVRAEDGWVARNATDRSAPLADPAPVDLSAPANVSKPPAASKAVQLSPNSTLRFVVPAGQYPNTENPAASGSPTRLGSSANGSAAVDFAADRAAPTKVAAPLSGNKTECGSEPLQPLAPAPIFAANSPHRLYGPGPAIDDSAHGLQRLPDQNAVMLEPAPATATQTRDAIAANAPTSRDTRPQNTVTSPSTNNSPSVADSAKSDDSEAPHGADNESASGNTDRSKPLVARGMVPEPELELLPGENAVGSDANDAAVDESLADSGSEPKTSEPAELGKLEIRRPRIEGINDPPSLSSRRIAARPAGRESGVVELDAEREVKRESRSEVVIESDQDSQSITDSPEEPVAKVNRYQDHINSQGELVFGLGLDPSTYRLQTATARLRTPIERTLSYYWQRPENAEERTHWGMFHSIMVFDRDTLIIDGKRRYSAVAWMAGNNPCRNDLLFETDRHGLNVRSGIGLQGHQAQLLAVFGLVDVPAAYPVYVGKTKYNVEDIIRREMRDCKPGVELTFTLIGLSHYIDTDSTWVSGDGEDWDFERLIQEELAQPIVGAACGGTHRLMGFANALRRRRAEGKPIEGQWARAEQYIADFIAYTWQLQNRDGSMSTEWFEKAEDNGKLDRKVQTTGHMIEFLVTALPDKDLQSPQMLRSINYLNTTLFEERGHEWQIGPKGHALRALALYYQRVFGRQDPWRPTQVARSHSNRNR